MILMLTAVVMHNQTFYDSFSNSIMSTV